MTERGSAGGPAPSLPACYVSPICGACGEELSSTPGTPLVYCYACQLGYGAGADGTVATFRDPTAEVCGFTCECPDTDCFPPCLLPKGHSSSHWRGDE